MKSLTGVCLIACLLVFRLDAWRTKIDVTERFLAVLPAAIEPEGFAMRNVRIGILDALIPDRCGVTTIGITDETARKIEEEGPKFFESITQSRSNLTQGRGPVVFSNWRKTPVTSAGSIGESMIMAVFSCAGRSGIPSRKIIEGLESGNAYISGKGYSQHYVLPGQKLFVHAFID